MNGRRICTLCLQVFWRVCKPRCLGRESAARICPTQRRFQPGGGGQCVFLFHLFICGALWPWLRTGWLQGPAGLPHLSLFSTWPVTWWDGSRAVPDPHTSCQAWHFCEITHRSACILFSKTTHRSRHRFETSAVVQLVGSIFISICDKTFWREIENFLTFEVIHLK